MEESISLSKFERQSLINQNLIIKNQYLIMRKLQIGNVDSLKENVEVIDDSIEILSGGFASEYEKCFLLNDEITEEKIQFVINILWVYNNINNWILTCAENEIIEIKNHENMKFCGFKCNYELEYLAIYKRLYKNEYMNYSIPISENMDPPHKNFHIEKYKKLINNFEKVVEKRHQPLKITKEDIFMILNV